MVKDTLALIQTLNNPGEHPILQALLQALKLDLVIKGDESWPNNFEGSVMYYYFQADRELLEQSGLRNVDRWFIAFENKVQSIEEYFVKLMNLFARNDSLESLVSFIERFASEGNINSARLLVIIKLLTEQSSEIRVWDESESALINSVAMTMHLILSEQNHWRNYSGRVGFDLQRIELELSRSGVPGILNK